MASPPSSKPCPAFGGGALCHPANGVCMFCSTPIFAPAATSGPPGIPAPQQRDLHKYAQHASMNGFAQQAHAIQNAAHASAYNSRYSAANGPHPYIHGHNQHPVYQQPHQPAQISPQQAYAAQHSHYSHQPAPQHPNDAFHQYHPQALQTYDPNAAIPQHLMNQWVGQAARNQPLPENERGFPGGSNAWNMAHLEYGMSKGGSGLR